MDHFLPLQHKNNANSKTTKELQVHQARIQFYYIFSDKNLLQFIRIYFHLWSTPVRLFCWYSRTNVSVHGSLIYPTKGRPDSASDRKRSKSNAEEEIRRRIKSDSGLPEKIQRPNLTREELPRKFSHDSQKKRKEPIKIEPEEVNSHP